MGMGAAVVILLFSFPIVVVAGFFVIWALKIAKSGGGADQRLTEETKIIQELNQGLTRMEQRIEALETILLEKDRNQDRKDG